MTHQLMQVQAQTVLAFGIKSAERCHEAVHAATMHHQLQTARHGVSDPRPETILSSCSIAPRALDPPLPVAQPPLLDDVLCRMLNLRDGVDHLRLHRPSRPYFSAHAAVGMTPVVERLVDELLDPHMVADGFDVIADLGVPLPVDISCHLLGLSPAERDQVTGWTQLVVAQIGAFGQTPQHMIGVEREIGEFFSFVEELCDNRRRRRRSGLVTRLVQHAHSDRLNPDELLSCVVMLLTNGLETMTTALGNAVWAVTSHQGVLVRLAAHPQHAERAFSESMRWMSPLRLGSRRMLMDVEFQGHHIGRGATVLFLWAAANRDPRQFRDPDVFDFHRPDLRHMAFGSGHHRCLGAPLATVMGAPVIRGLARRWPNLIVATDSRLRSRTDIVMAGFHALLVTLSGRDAPDREAPW